MRYAVKELGVWINFDHTVLLKAQVSVPAFYLQVNVVAEARNGARDLVCITIAYPQDQTRYRYNISSSVIMKRRAKIVQQS